MKFTYAVTINALPAYDDKQYLETLTGEVEAENYGQAKEQAQSLAWDHCKQLEQERGIIVGYENVRLQAVTRHSTKQEEVLTPQEYQHCALRTLYPDLSASERLGLCGLGLSGEIGEGTDLLKKFLYHRNGKPLPVDKLKDELGDVLWYFAVLLDTLGLTFEEVMAANAAKLEERHPNGFTPHYTSDSHASENPEQRAIVLYETPSWIDPSPTRPLTQEEEQ